MKNKNKLSQIIIITAEAFLILFLGIAGNLVSSKITDLMEFNSNVIPVAIGVSATILALITVLRFKSEKSKNEMKDKNTDGEHKNG